VLLLWFSVYQELADPSRLAPGAAVLVTGELDQYAGELQLIPTHAGDVCLDIGNQ